MNIFIFDDHDMLRKGLIACFSDSSTYTLVGEAKDIISAKKIITDYVPNFDVPTVAIVDVGFSEDGYIIEKALGFELVSFITKSNKNIKCLMYSSYSGQAYIRKAISQEIGASGYISKTSDSNILIEGVNAVAKGKTYIDPYLSSVLVETNNVYDLLSKREKEVLTLVQKNYSNEEISKELNITNRTTENHLSAIYTKVDVKNKEQLIEMFGRL